MEEQEYELKCKNISVSHFGRLLEDSCGEVYPDSTRAVFQSFSYASSVARDLEAEGGRVTIKNDDNIIVYQTTN